MPLEDLISGDTLKLRDKGLHVYRMMTQYFARDDSGLRGGRMPYVSGDVSCQ